MWSEVSCRLLESLLTLTHRPTHSATQFNFVGDKLNVKASVGPMRGGNTPLDFRLLASFIPPLHPLPPRTHPPTHPLTPPQYPMHYVPEILMVALTVMGVLALRE